jgi:cell division protein FtsZ
MVDAANMAISSPLLEMSIDGAKGVLYNITGGADLGIQEVYEAADIIARAADPDAQIIFGATIDPNLNDEVRITLIATGFENVPRTNQRTRSFPNVASNVLPSQAPQPATPAFQPRQPQAPQAPQAPAQRPQPSFNNGSDDLDIPPFLRNRRR